MSDKFINIAGLSFGYGERILFSDINLEVKSGSKLVIHGKNGSGKSTFLAILADLKECKGSVSFSDNLRLAYLFQNSNDQFIAPSVLEDVAFSLLADGVDEETAKKKSLDMLEKFNILHIKNSSIYNLSGGEKRLVAIAGVLVREADVYLLDEPFNELDDEKIELVISEIYKKQTFIIITHSKKELLHNVISYEFKDGKLIKISKDN